MTAGDNRHDLGVSSVGAVAEPTWTATSSTSLITGSAVIVRSDRDESQLRAGADRLLPRLARGELEHGTCTRAASPRATDRSSLRTASTRSSLSRKTASIGKRMNQVWMEGDGRSSKPSPAGSSRRPSRPRRRGSGRSAIVHRAHSTRRCFVGHGDGRAAHRTGPPLADADVSEAVLEAALLDADGDGAAAGRADADSHPARLAGPLAPAGARARGANEGLAHGASLCVSHGHDERPAAASA